MDTGLHARDAYLNMPLSENATAFKQSKWVPFFAQTIDCAQQVNMLASNVDDCKILVHGNVKGVNHNSNYSADLFSLVSKKLSSGDYVKLSSASDNAVLTNNPLIESLGSLRRPVGV